MFFSYQRTVTFKDTDAAGVVYFANVLSMCHEAYESSLIEAGITLRAFFGARHRAIPIVHASVDFFQPMFCGETYTIELTSTFDKTGYPMRDQASEFAIAYTLYPLLSPVLAESSLQASPLPAAASQRQAIARAQTRHVCINPQTRTRLALDDQMMMWLQG